MTENEQPAPQPDAEELWRRNQLALSVLNQRKPTVETVVLAQRALRGEDIETLMRSDGEE
jgi:hypothetical protein